MKTIISAWTDVFKNTNGAECPGPKKCELMNEDCKTAYSGKHAHIEGDKILIDENN
jgi:hypothetical protein